MGFIYVALGIAYVIISAIIILLGGWIVKAFGKRPRRWYIGATIVSFLILFWDYLPTYILFRYYCNTQCGVTVNKTLDQWNIEHPDAFYMRHPVRELRREKIINGTRYWLNRRIAYESTYNAKPLSIYENTQKIVDIPSGDVLYKFVSYGVQNHMQNPKRFRDYKIWLQFGQCVKYDKCLQGDALINDVIAESRGEK